MATSTTHDEFSAALAAWRESLVSLSGVNRLLRFRPSKTGSVLIDDPDADVILGALEKKIRFAFRGQAETESELDDPDLLPPRPLPIIEGSILHSPRPDGELGPVLRGLMRRTTQEFLDRGVSVLYLSFGMLHWRDVDNTAMASPLLLVPAALVPQGPKGVPQLELGDDEYVMNPALSLRLQEHNVSLPTVDELDELNVREVLDRVQNAIDRGGKTAKWEIKQTTYLSTFSFAKEAMYRDLIDNESQILDHPIIRALATKDPREQVGDFGFEPIDPADIDQLAPPEMSPLVLDADSSQRSAIAAAVAGRSFVMDGPPGTGKSQTIANMIGALLHAGKSVLFVSEKVAALEVVRTRLDDVGLGNYLLELHSHKTSRKEVATELLRTLESETVDPGAMNSHSRLSAKEKREQLNNYAKALNEKRSPLDMSVHDVLGVLSDLVHEPTAPSPTVPPRDLSQSQYRTIEKCLGRLARAWRPVVEGRSFLWREIEDRTSLDIRLYHARETLNELRTDVGLVGDLANAFALHRIDDIPRLAELISHQHAERPDGVPSRWLTVKSLQQVVDAFRHLSTQIEAFEKTRSSFIEATGVDYSAVPEPSRFPAGPTVSTIDPSPLAIDGMSAADLWNTASEFEARAKTLRSRHRDIQRVATLLALGTVETFTDASRVISLVELRNADDKPDRRWLTRTGVTSAREALVSLRAHAKRLMLTEQAANSRFTPDALQVPLAELNDRFLNLHKGLRRLSGAYRADKKVVAGLLKDASSVKDGIQHLTDAIAWDEAARSFNETATHHAPALGRYWKGLETDFAAVERGLAVAEEALHIYRDNVPFELADFLAGVVDDGGMIAITDAARIEFDNWKANLQSASATAGHTELMLEPIDVSSRWLEAHVIQMRKAHERIEFTQAVVPRVRTLADVSQVFELRKHVESALLAVTTSDDSYRACFGTLYEGVDTAVDVISVAIDWALQVRDICKRHLTDLQVQALESAPNLTGLRATFDRWLEHRDKIVRAFGEARHEELYKEFNRFDDATTLIAELQSDTIGHDEWFSFQDARQELSDCGLEAAVGFCIDRKIEATSVLAVVQRSLLRAWVDDILQFDSRLHPLSASDRETLVQEYKNLDEELILKAVSDIIQSVNSRRPLRTTLGEPGIIRRQGMLKRKHIAVRDLIKKTQNTTLALKPCFMMSPLAVSQYLPSDMRFDVVIFDEASQVTPGDAVNCIYRGGALVLAGDDKQLPPTSFFERVVDDEDNEDTDVTDFQSILELAKGAGAFLNIKLNWHYRSRHESLIAFSNYKFYEGKLITYPSACSEGKDVGVQFFHAHGTYRRGGGADNPEEAAKVAERVIEHYTNRPELTLGVVTFSVAQADAVTSALDRAREGHPYLEQYFDRTDRLSSFFIRSLESVQGDERDVIIFSVGYGPDEANKITTNFGVLNKSKGWRRLNVGITRARQRIEVVASMRAGDIPPSVNENVEYLRAYLDYADRGIESLAITHESTNLGPESPFEESVLSTIRSWGYTVEPQVGAAGFRIDMGVRHPTHPGLFAIGIECDGYQYHSAPAARDRDRLREQILRGLGWKLHRIWGTGWYRNRNHEEGRLRAAIEDAIASPIDGGLRPTNTLARPAVLTVESKEEQQPAWTTEYVVAPAMSLHSWVEPSARSNHPHLRDPLTHLVRIEGPIHLELVYERVRDWWDIGRLSYKVRENIDLAIDGAPIDRDGQFLDVPGRLIDSVRVPANGVSRKAEQIHPTEIALATEFLLRDIGAEDRTALVRGIARIFGWARVGTAVDHAVSAALDLLHAQNRIVNGDGRFRLPN